jgi:DNA-binding SARP family transcriptional activator
VSAARSSLRLDTRPERPHARVSLQMLDGFDVHVDGHALELPLSAQRVVAFVALHERPVLRSFVAGSLWLDCPEARAAGNLRSALWRIQRLSRSLVVADPRMLRMGSAVVIDVRELERLTRGELERGGADVPLRRLSADLLPDWYEDWVLIERERFRQLRLRALEVACERLASEGRLGEALDAGLLALAGEPLRESAHRALIRVHLADGNIVEAARQYKLCRRLLREQLGVEVSERMRELVAGVDVGETIW